MNPSESERPALGGGGAVDSPSARPAATTGSNPPPVIDVTPARGRSPAWVSWLGLLLAGLACVLAVLFWQRSERVIREAARKWQDAEQRVGLLEQQLKITQDQARDNVGRSALLDNKVADVVGQQAQLERMYRNIAQNSLDVVLADVENSLSMAAQQLLLGSNVQGALLALQDADALLKRVDQGSVSVLRRLLARDIERLKALPATDIASMAARLDAVASTIDQLPLLADGADSVGSAAAPSTSADTSSTFGRITESGLRGWNSLTQELLALLRVTRVDSPDALLLAPPQQYFVRENLRLTLLSARFALLSRNEAIFKSDLDRAIKWLAGYYDKQSRSVSTASASLKQLQATRVSLELPSLAESMAAVRSQRSTPEGRP